jgi:cytochrome c biogenesis factor
MHASSSYLGSMASSVPFTLSVAALASGRLDAEWSVVLRRWAVLSWVFLTIGMFAGMWWSYVEAGDVGHWAVEPVRSLSIVPWLTMSALLYSMRLERTRASVILALTSFLLAALGAFVVRDGMVSMNPAASWTAPSEWLTAFFAVSALIAAYLLVTRLPRLESEVPASRERRADRWRIGKRAMLLGLVLVAAGLIASRFSKEVEITIGSGETVAIADPFGGRTALTSQGVSRFDELNRHVVAVAIQVARNGKSAELVTSEERQYFDSRGAHTFNSTIEAGIDYSLKQDVHVVLTGVTGDRAQMRVALNPLVMWVWIGGAMIAVGGALAMWDGR